MLLVRNGLRKKLYLCAYAIGAADKYPFAFLLMAPTEEDAYSETIDRGIKDMEGSEKRRGMSFLVERVSGDVRGLAMYGYSLTDDAKRLLENDTLYAKATQQKKVK
jgi:hypothetical protein